MARSRNIITGENNPEIPVDFEPDQFDDASEGSGSGELRIYPYEYYYENCRFWEFMDLSFEGGHRYKKGCDSEGSDIFQQHRKESDEDAEKRCNRSSVPNFSRFFIQRFDGYIESNTPPSGRDFEDSDWKQFMDNCDGAGTRFEDFMRDTSFEATQKSPYWIGMDLPEIGGDRMLSISQAQELNQRPVLFHVDPKNIIDFEEDDAGVLTRLVVRDSVRSKPSATEKEETIFKFYEWTPTEVIEYEQIGLAYSYSGSFQVKRIGSKQHTIGFIPFVPAYFFKPKKKNPMFSPSLLHDVADWQRDIFRMLSLLLEEVNNRTFTTTFIAGVSPQELKPQIKSTVIATENSDASIQRSGADTKQASSLLDVLHFLIRNLFRAAQFESSGDTKESRTAESGIKRSRDLEGLYQVLAGFSARMERTENQVIQMWAKMMGKSNFPHVSYTREFDVRDDDSVIDNLMDMVSIGFPEEFVHSEMWRIMRKLSPRLTDAQIRVINEQLAEAELGEEEPDPNGFEV